MVRWNNSAQRANRAMDKADALPQPPASEQAALQQRALIHLARREHSRRELERKLAREGAPAALIRDVLDELAAHGLQSDARYAEALVAARLIRGQGVQRIRRELADSGIDAEVMNAALASAAIDWQQRAREVCRQKFGTSAPADRAEWARRARFLQYRGFEAGVIRAVLASPCGEGEES